MFANPDQSSDSGLGESVNQSVSVSMASNRPERMETSHDDQVRVKSEYQDKPGLVGELSMNLAPIRNMISLKTTTFTFKKVIRGFHLVNYGTEGTLSQFAGAWQAKGRPTAATPSTLDYAGVNPYYSYR